MNRRAGGTRSKKGCITCKLRHVKCGEEKPQCSQCLDTGFKCEGYSDASQKQLREQKNQSQPHPRRSAILGADRAIALVPGNREERQYLHSFSTEATHALSGFFPSEFWNVFLPQLSHHNTTIRHAVTAVGAMYEQRALRVTSESSRSENFALQHYNKAIQSFVGQLSHPQTPNVDVMLITCALFVCLEMLRYDLTRAMDHINGGLQILQSRSSQGRSALEQSLDRHLLRLFHRLNIQNSLFGRSLLVLDLPSETPTIQDLEEGFCFESIDQARETLINITNRALALIQSIDWMRPIVPEAVHQQRLQKQQDSKREFRTWLIGFEAMKRKPPKSVGISDPRAPLQLTMTYHSSYFWLCNCLQRDEMGYDAYFANFETVVSSAEQIIALSSEPKLASVTKPFSMDAEVTPPLWWTAYKCRHPMVRRRAMEALKRYPTREGMWEIQRQVRAIEIIIEREEAAVSHLPVEKRNPDDDHRIYAWIFCPEGDRLQAPCPFLVISKSDIVNGAMNGQWEVMYW